MCPPNTRHFAVEVRSGTLTDLRWALANPHLSLHIPASSRISQSTQVKRNGRPRRPPASLTSIVSNLHLLLDVPSFARWPLKLHFFASEVHAAWEKRCKSTEKSLRKTLPVVTDFAAGKPTTKAPVSDVEDENLDMTQKPEQWGIHALPLDYAPLKDYVAKGNSVIEFEQEGKCVVCHEPLESGKGLHVICNNHGCEGVGHLACWSQHLLSSCEQGEDVDILPLEGACPKCHGAVDWGLMMKELTLRTRGKKDVEKLLKEKRKRAAKA
jgi:structure-specific endonuclease subunit SLX1